MTLNRLSEKQTGWLLFFLTLLIFTIGLGNRDFIGFETRFALFTKQMLQNGFGFFPYVDSQAYPDYPVLGTWLTYLSSIWIGKETIFTMVFPSAVASSLTVLFTYRIGRLHDVMWGWYAVVFSFLTFYFLDSARTVSLDQFIATVSVFCFYALSLKQFESASRLWRWIPLALIIGFAFRGPIGIIIPTAVIVAFLLIDKQWMSIVKYIILSIILIILCTLVLLACAYAVEGKAFVKQVLDMQVLNRFSARRISSAYYFTQTFSNYALAFPVAVLWVVGRFDGLCRDFKKFRLHWKLIAWVLIILIGMTVPNDKKMRYVLVITPAIALLSGFLFLEDTHNHNVFTNALRKVVLFICQILPWLSLAAIFIGSIASRHNEFAMQAYYGNALVLLLIVCVLSAIYLPKLTNIHSKQLFILSSAAATFIILNICIVEPVNTAIDNTSNFMNRLEAYWSPSQTLTLYQFGPDGPDVPIRANMQASLKMKYLQEPQQLSQVNDEAVVISDEDNYARVPQEIRDQYHVLMKGRLHHREVVAIKK